MTQYKFPRALVSNPAKLKQLQERVFLPMYMRLEIIKAVLNFEKLPLSPGYRDIPARDHVKAKGYAFEREDTIEVSFECSGPLILTPSPPDWTAEIGWPLAAANGISTDRVGPIVATVLLANAKEHEPQIIQAWEKINAAFMVTVESLRVDAQAIAKELAEKFTATGLWGAVYDEPQIRYVYLALHIMRWRLGIPYNPQIFPRPENGELSIESQTCAQRIGELVTPLTEEILGAIGKPILREKYALGLVKQAKAVEETMEALKYVLALVPGERPPLEYDAATGLLTFEERQTRFNKDTAAKAIFDHLVLYRAAGQGELIDVKGEADKRKEAEAPRRKENTTTAKEAISTAIKEINEKLASNGIPLRIDGTTQRYQLSATVNLPEV